MVMDTKEQGDAKSELLDKDGRTPEIKAYKRRWIILAIYIYYACINCFQWIEYSSITHLVVKYYKVSNLMVNWTSIVYMLLYPILVIPASYIINKKGLRTAALIGCIGTLIGTGVKVASIRNDLFSIVLLGQTITAASQLVIVSLPPKIAAIWFKPNEVSTSCSLGLFGIQFGTALGYILPPIIVKDSDDSEVLGNGFKVLCWTLTAAMIPVTLAALLYFPNQPPSAPSLAQAKLRYETPDFQTKVFFKSLVKLCTDKGFLAHMIAYGINVAVFSAVGTLLNQFVIGNFEGASEDAGHMGFCMVIFGMIGTVLFGICLDKTHKYKETSVFVSSFSSLSVVFLMYALEWKSKKLSYLACCAVGMFTNAYMLVGFELSMELTYPAEESSTTGILIATAQVMGAIATVVLGYLNDNLGSFWSLSSQAMLLVIGTVFTLIVPNRLLRQKAFNGKQVDVEKKPSLQGTKLLFTK